MKLISPFAIAALWAFAAPAFAVDCNLTTWTALAATDCRGSFSGNINGDGSEMAYLQSQFAGEWSFSGKSDDADNGPFAGNPMVGVDGTLDFDAPISGRFVIGLKASNDYSYYLFDAATPVSSLTFLSTLGVTDGAGPNVNPKDLSHAALYVTAVPEPETYALMIAGLAVVGFVARRRRSA